MTPNPILKALFLIQQSGLQCLLMGGQACVFYGSSEFSRDIDLAILISPENIKKLNNFLTLSQSINIAVPTLDLSYLEKGHAIHFRSTLPEMLNLRIDIMSKMRGVDNFEKLWERRTILELEQNLQINLLSIADLVKAKKTARDKDWPMIRKLVESDFFNQANNTSKEKITFFLMELRTPEILIKHANQHKSIATELAAKRSLLKFALSGDKQALISALQLEEDQERSADKIYWEPLKKELEKLRHAVKDS